MATERMTADLQDTIANQAAALAAGKYTSRGGLIATLFYNVETLVAWEQEASRNVDVLLPPRNSSSKG